MASGLSTQRRLELLQDRLSTKHARPGVMVMPVAASLEEWEAKALPHMARLMEASRVDDAPASLDPAKRGRVVHT